MRPDREINRNDNDGRDADLIKHLGDALQHSLVESIVANQPPIASKDAALIERAIGSVLRQIYAEVAREPLPDRLNALLDELAAKDKKNPR